MVNNQLDQCRKELNDKHLYVPDEWLERIINKQSTEQSNNQLNFNYLFKRWLDTNLLELNYSSVNLLDQLPDWAFPPAKFNLNPTFFQIIKVKDVGKPEPNDFCEELYSKKDENEDEDQFNELYVNMNFNSAIKQDNQTNKESAKSNRQLYFELFNGMKLFKASEFEPIKQLNFTNCFPGAKLSIKGEIELSFGVILLKQKNVSPFGGLRLQQTN